MLAPSLAWSLVEAIRNGGSKGRHLLLWASAAFFASAVILADFKSFINIHAIGVHSWGSLFYFAYLLTEPHTPAQQVVQQPTATRLAA